MSELFCSGKKRQARGVGVFARFGQRLCKNSVFGDEHRNDSQKSPRSFSFMIAALQPNRTAIVIPKAETAVNYHLLAFSFRVEQAWRYCMGLGAVRHH